jgi:hypothetical protein
LNATETSVGTKGLLLPRVALVSTDNAYPLTKHIVAMQVFNTNTDGDVTPGVYYNDGTKWVRVGNGTVSVTEEFITELTENNTFLKLIESRERYYEVSIPFGAINTGSRVFRGEIRNPAAQMNVLNIKPVFSNPLMAHNFFTITHFAAISEDGRTIYWSVKIQNDNIDPSITNVLQKVIVSYLCDEPIPEPRGLRDPNATVFESEVVGR